MSGIASFSFLETPEGKQMTLKAKASMNDECGATASIGASAELLSLPFTLIQWNPMQNSIARPMPGNGFLMILKKDRQTPFSLGRKVKFGRRHNNPQSKLNKKFL